MKKTVLSFIFLSSITLAHEGPAYPLLVDRPLDSKNSLSIWADPDTDKGTFDLFIEGDVQTNYQIHLSAAPANDPSHVLMAWALPLKRVGTRQNFRSVLPFDRELVWNVEFVLKQNEGAENTFTLPVEV
ncbi:MAG: hypothetical protein ACXVLQ_15025, partial [Bacteriovorax sp.]